jgi:hypothetical protein
MEMDVILLVDHAQGWQEDLLMLFLIFVRILLVQLMASLAAGD